MNSNQSIDQSCPMQEISLAEAIQTIIEHDAQIPAMRALTESLAATVAQYKVKERRRVISEIR